MGEKSASVTHRRCHRGGDRRWKARSFPDGEEMNCSRRRVTLKGKKRSRQKPVFYPQTDAYNPNPHSSRDKKRATAVISFANGQIWVVNSQMFQSTNCDDLKIQLEWSKLPSHGMEMVPENKVPNSWAEFFLLYFLSRCVFPLHYT